jgi:tripartite-type tricarboxylate transporter receptor subunit TctC
VPYKGGSEAFQAVIGRHPRRLRRPRLRRQVQGGKVRLLATFTAERLKRYDVPTVKELATTW